MTRPTAGWGKSECDRAAAAYLSTYEDPYWGLKASPEDALLSVLAALRPDAWTHEADPRRIYTLRACPALVRFAEDLYEWQTAGLDEHAIGALCVQRIHNLKEEGTL
jgi:hypothetical protein